MQSSTMPVCKVCGNNVGISRFKIADGYCCRKCFDKAGLDISASIENMLSFEIKDMIATKELSESLTPETQINKPTVEPKKSTGTDSVKNAKVTLLCILVVAVISWVIVFVNANLINTHRNLEAIEASISESLALDIAEALDLVGSTGNRYKLKSDDIVFCGNNAYEIKTAFTARLILDGDQFKIYTFDKTFDESVPQLLYDSTDRENYRALTALEQQAFRQSQRKYAVQSVIWLTAQDGVINPNGLIIEDYFEFTVRNVSDKTIKSIYFEGFSKGDEEKRLKYYFNSENHFSLKNPYTDKSIEPGETRKYDIAHHGWSFEDAFDLSVFVVTFKDGTKIRFDEYDVQFLIKE